MPVSGGVLCIVALLSPLGVCRKTNTKPIRSLQRDPTVKPRGLLAINGDPMPSLLSLPITPLALICCLLSFLQLLQGSGQALLGSVQLLLHQLDTAVQRSHFSLSLREQKPLNHPMSHTYIHMHIYFLKSIFGGYFCICYPEHPLALCNKPVLTGMGCLTMHPLAVL